MRNSTIHFIQKPKTHGVYILHCQGFYKIGLARSIEKRVKELQTGNPFVLEVVIFMPCYKASFVEKQLHEHFSSHRRVGEWFKFSETKLEKAIQLLKNMAES